MRSILLDLERMKYPNTGLYHYCSSLATHLLKHKHADEGFQLFIPKALKGSFGDQVRYITLQLHSKLYMTGTRDVQVWHMTHQQSKYYPVNANTKMVLTIHDLNYLHESDSERRKNKYNAMVLKGIERANIITCISEFVKKDVMQNLATFGKPVKVIYNGCNFQDIEPEYIPTYIPAKPFLFSLGIIGAKKNFHVVPSILPSLDAELIISGTPYGDYNKKIMAEAKKFGVEDRVHLTGPVSEKDKNWYLKNCKAFIFPSLAEGFGLPVLEAMYYGKPVFLSRLTSLPEVGGEHAYYFDNFLPEHMRDVFEKGMHHYETTHPQELIKAWAMRFSWDNTAREYLSIYRKLRP